MSELKIKKKNMSLPSRNANINSLINESSVDTRTEVEKEKSNKRFPKSLILEEEAYDTLSELVECTKLSERTILGELMSQALQIMKPKVTFALENDHVPKLNILPRK